MLDRLKRRCGPVAVHSAEGLLAPTEPELLGETDEPVQRLPWLGQVLSCVATRGRLEVEAVLHRHPVCQAQHVYDAQRKAVERPAHAPSLRRPRLMPAHSNGLSGDALSWRSHSQDILGLLTRQHRRR